MTTATSTTIVTLEPGIFRRIDPRSGRVLPRLWIHYPGRDGKKQQESTGGTSIIAARKLRAKRLEQHGRGEPGRAAEIVKVDALLDALVVNYEVNARASLRTLRSHLTVLRPAFGHLRAIDLTTDRYEAVQRTWQSQGTSNATINRRRNMLARAFNLGRRAGKVHVVPYLPRLEEHSPRGREIRDAEATALRAHLPAHLQDLFTVAMAYGIRKGQLTRTLRRFVDLDQGVVTWPPAECKAKEPHIVPFEGEALAAVERLMRRPPLHCPYLFHGAHCAPGQQPSKEYGCVGDFKKAWRSACRKAGLPVGRKVGGFVFHHTRNSAVTHLRALGLPEDDCMQYTGHQTRHVFQHYNLKDTAALRARLVAARGSVSPLRGRAKQTGAE